MTQRSSNLISAELVSVEYATGTDYLAKFTFRPERTIGSSRGIEYSRTLGNSDEKLFLPGQYVTLGVSRERLTDVVDLDKYPTDVKTISGKETILRAYSVASPPKNENIELYITRVDRDGRRTDGRGVLSTELFESNPESEYTLFPRATGVFLLPEHSEERGFTKEDKRDRVMIATGTGIAPYMSMLKSTSTEKDGRRFFLFHGVAYPEDHEYKDDIKRLMDEIDLKYIPITSRGELKEYPQRYVEEFFLNREEGISGRVNEGEVKKAIEQGMIRATGIEEILEHELNPRNTLLMLCGNPGMTDNIGLIAEALEFKKRADLLTEDYW